ncbi:class I adenylate-forming enzyme family protein [Lutimonas vermicola]|uniref:AMP-binding protein n=1 Tax=Lutimonas vermicola TaxID=414288 RepID=A0ABU9L4U3_9FLAO
MNVFDYFFKETKGLEKDFVLGNKETISFKELYNNSLKIASFLKENYGTNQNIILINQNSVFFITVYLGIIKSGNVCVPLDFSIEQGNFNFIANTTESSIIFCGKRINSKLELNIFRSIIDEDSFEKIVKNNSISDFLIDFDSENLAEIIFTSGSTGKPKGVMISHQNIISNTDSILGYLDLTEDDILLVVLPFYYCYGLSLLHTHLKAGASIVLNNTFMFLGTVFSDLSAYKCTGFSGVPSHFQMMLKKSNIFKSRDFPDLVYVTQAGGKLNNVFIEEFVSLMPNVKFFTMYGQTEATARLSYLPPEMVLRKIGSVGKAITNVVLKLMNEEGEEVKIGETGEIVAKGGNIMLGYYKDPQGTNEILNDGWLSTGDLGIIDSEGYIYIVARKMEIVKIGGKRISLREVEEVVLSVAEVQDCKVETIEDDLLGESLKLVVVIDELLNQKSVEKKILARCRSKLALFKIPRLIEFVASISVSKTGKRIRSTN